MKVTGSLQEKRGIYQMMLRVEESPGRMKQRMKSTGIRAQGKNQRETRANKLAADRMLAEYISEIQNGSPTSDKLLLEAIEIWLEKKRKTLRTDTYESYLCTYEAHLKPYFAKRPLKFTEVSPKDLAKYVDDKLSQGKSANTIRKHLVIFNGVFKDALRLGEIQTNPCQFVTVKDDRESFSGTAYTPETAKKLIQAVSGDPIESAVYLGLYLGLRRSEVAGLRWKDIDFDGDLVHICNTVVRYTTISEQEKTKNPASKRTLCLPEGLKRYLLSLDRGKPDDHICKLAPDYISHRFHKVLERSGLPIIRFHDLRHTAGSMLINEGQGILQVQNFLGHKKASTTLDIYSHIYLEGKKATASKLDELLDISLDVTRVR